MHKKMSHKLFFLFVIGFFTQSLSMFANSYTSYFSGNNEDKLTSPMGGICLMGGATENDEAMKWFLNRANGGDILVLRASGSDGYNEYMLNELGVTINSVETIVFHSKEASFDEYIHSRIDKAEGIWFAGGDQWNYINYWRETPIAELINDAVINRNIVIGGTSAGMAILGQFYFSAKNGTVTSEDALAEPYNNRVTVDNQEFLKLNLLENVITDTHFDKPDRRGRLVTFLARIKTDFGIDALGLACEEYTAVCIEPSGKAIVFGNYPEYDDFAYFVQANCEITNNSPEQCSNGSPLEWNLNNSAIKTYVIPATSKGTSYFNLKDRTDFAGGFWEDWYVETGALKTKVGTEPNCDNTSICIPRCSDYDNLLLYPNPIADGMLSIDNNGEVISSVKFYTANGVLLMQILNANSSYLNIATSDLPSGLILVEIENTFGKTAKRIIINQ